MNPTKNNILPTYLGHYGPSYTSNDKIPNPWTMIPNMYYLGNPPHSFSNIISHVTYLFPNMVSTGLAAIGGSQGVQMFVMTLVTTAPIGGFSTKIWCFISNHPHEPPPLGFWVWDIYERWW
jgi:hypothetical protein